MAICNSDNTAPFKISWTMVTCVHSAASRLIRPQTADCFSTPSWSLDYSYRSTSCHIRFEAAWCQETSCFSAVPGCTICMSLGITVFKNTIRQSGGIKQDLPSTKGNDDNNHRGRWETSAGWVSWSLLRADMNNMYTIALSWKGAVIELQMAIRLYIAGCFFKAADRHSANRRSACMVCGKHSETALRLLQEC